MPALQFAGIHTCKRASPLNPETMKERYTALNREQARAELNRRNLTDFYSLERSRNGAQNQYICPICGSGKGKHKSGALTYFADSNRYMCFSCPEKEGFGKPGQDTLGALRLLWECSETEALERAGYSIDRRSEAAALGWNDTIQAEYPQDAHREPQRAAQAAQGTATTAQQNAPQRGAEGLAEPPADFTRYYAEVYYGKYH